MFEFMLLVPLALIMLLYMTAQQVRVVEISERPAPAKQKPKQKSRQEILEERCQNLEQENKKLAERNTHLEIEAQKTEYR